MFNNHDLCTTTMQYNFEIKYLSLIYIVVCLCTHYTTTHTAIVIQHAMQSHRTHTQHTVHQCSICSVRSYYDNIYILISITGKNRFRLNPNIICLMPDCINAFYHWLLASRPNSPSILACTSFVHDACFFFWRASARERIACAVCASECLNDMHKIRSLISIPVRNVLNNNEIMKWHRVASERNWAMKKKIKK